MVDLPLPFGPVMTTMRSSTVRLTSLRIWRTPSSVSASKQRCLSSSIGWFPLLLFQKSSSSNLSDRSFLKDSLDSLCWMSRPMLLRCLTTSRITQNRLSNAGSLPQAASTPMGADERTADAVIYYTGDREELIHKLKKFHFEKADVPDNVLSSSGRALNSAYREKLIAKTLLHYGGKLLLPNSVRKIWLTFKVVPIYRKRDSDVWPEEDRGAGIRCYSDWRVRAARRL